MWKMIFLSVLSKGGNKFSKGQRIIAKIYFEQL